jgi:hypothetical protein
VTVPNFAGPAREIAFVYQGQSISLSQAGRVPLTISSASPASFQQRRDRNVHREHGWLSLFSKLFLSSA